VHYGGKIVLQFQGTANYDTNISLATEHCLRYSIQINQPTRCNCFSRVYYSTFICGSTCFGRHPAHHQEHATALGASGSTFGRKGLKRCFIWIVWWCTDLRTSNVSCIS